jgi:putative phage-type endonuclease
MSSIKGYIRKNYQSKNDEFTIDEFKEKLEFLKDYFEQKKKLKRGVIKNKISRLMKIKNGKIVPDVDNPENLKYDELINKLNNDKSKESKMSQIKNRYIKKKKIDKELSEEIIEDDTTHPTDFEGEYNWGGDLNYDDESYNDDEKRRENIYNKLCKIVTPEQRSEEWFELRNQCLSASDGGSIDDVNPYEAKYKIIDKKLNGSEFKPNEFCYHGTKLEEVATKIYEYRMNVKVTEFGLIRHPTISCLGASPDGIVSNKKLNGGKSKYVGRMLEIKCPFKRKIKHYGNIRGDICPSYYWVQIQQQLECCNLDQCDFWQCDIDEYKSREDFLNDSSSVGSFFRSKTTGLERGVLIELIPKNSSKDYYNEKLSSSEKNSILYDKAAFIYYPNIEYNNISELDQWVGKTLANLFITHPDHIYHKTRYWYLKGSNCVTVERDKKWFNNYLPKVKKLWNIILHFRNNPTDKEKLTEFIKAEEKKLYSYYHPANKEIKNKINKNVLEFIEKNFNIDDIRG